MVLVDARRGPGESDQQLIEFVRSRPEPRPQLMVVATKIDKIAKSKRHATLRKLDAVGVSAVTGFGLEQLWKLLRAAAFG